MQTIWSIMLLGSAAGGTCPLADLANPVTVVTGQEIRITEGLWIVDLEVDLANIGEDLAKPTDLRWRAHFSAPAGAKGHHAQGIAAIAAITPGASQRLPFRLEVPIAAVQDSGGQIRTELRFKFDWDASDHVKECNETNRAEFEYVYVSPSLTPREVEEQTLSGTLIKPDPKASIDPQQVKGAVIQQPVMPRKPGSKIPPKPVDPRP